MSDGVVQSPPEAMLGLISHLPLIGSPSLLPAAALVLKFLRKRLLEGAALHSQRVKDQFIH